MYFPILRGRQFELLALRECVNKSLLSNKIIPIVEPVSYTHLIRQTGEDIRIIHIAVKITHNPAPSCNRSADIP